MKHIMWQILIIFLLLSTACQQDTSKKASDIVLTRSDIDALNIDISRIYGNFRFMNDTNAVVAYDITGGPQYLPNVTKNPDLINKVVIFNTKEEAELAYRNEVRKKLATIEQVNEEIEERMAGNRSFLVMNITQNIRIGDMSYITETRSYSQHKDLLYVTLSSTFVHDKIITQLQLTTIKDIPIAEFFSIIRKIEQKIKS